MVTINPSFNTFVPSGRSTPTDETSPAGGALPPTGLGFFSPSDVVSWMDKAMNAVEEGAVPTPMAGPTSEQIQSAYDAINWENPSLESIMKLLTMIYSKLKASNNEAKWAEAKAQFQAMKNEASQMEEGAATQMWTTIGTSIATIGLSAISLKSNVSQAKEISGLTKGLKLTDVTADGSFAVNNGLFKRVQADIGNIQLQGAITNAKVEIGKAVSQGAGAVGQYNAELHNAQAKEEAAEGTARGANQQSAQTAEQTSDENIAKAREILQSLLQLTADTDRSIARNV